MRRQSNASTPRLSQQNKVDWNLRGSLEGSLYDGTRYSMNCDMGPHWYEPKEAFLSRSSKDP